MEIWATKSLQYSDSLLVLVFTEKPARRFVCEHHENLENNYYASRDECYLPVFQADVAAITLLVVDAKKVGKEDANGDKELITASKEAFQSSRGYLRDIGLKLNSVSSEVLLVLQYFTMTYGHTD